MPAVARYARARLSLARPRARRLRCLSPCHVRVTTGFPSPLQQVDAMFGDSRELLAEPSSSLPRHRLITSWEKHERDEDVGTNATESTVVSDRFGKSSALPARRGVIAAAEKVLRVRNEESE